MNDAVKDIMDEALYRAQTHEMIVTAEKLSNSVREMTETPKVGICALLLAAAVLAKIQCVKDGSSHLREMFEGVYNEVFVEEKIVITTSLKDD